MEKHTNLMLFRGGLSQYRVFYNKNKPFDYDQLDNFRNLNLKLSSE